MKNLTVPGGAALEMLGNVRQRGRAIAAHASAVARESETTWSSPIYEVGASSKSIRFGNSQVIGLSSQ
jgi:hypothetical protein